MTDDQTRFDSDIANHRMTIICDSGVHRHLRFSRPDSLCMHFNLITWPGYLCYTGDMGTYVFTRLRDMFEFFHGDAINPSYWAEKVVGQDKSDGIRQWSAAKFTLEVQDYVNHATADSDEWMPARKDELWRAVTREVLAEADEGEHYAWAALRDFRFDGFRFSDWERDCQEWSYRYLWCCRALVWAIDKYYNQVKVL